MRELRLTTSVPPTTNNAYLNLARGRALTPKGKAYKREVLFLVRTAELPKLELEPPYKLTILLYFPDNKRRDCSNFIKLAEDSLMEAIGADDKNVAPLYVDKFVDRDNPRAEITLEGAE